MSHSSDTETAEDQASTTVEDLKALLREAEHALGSNGGSATDEIQALRERLRDVLADGQSSLKNLTDTVRRKAARANEVVRAKPYQTIGAAAVVGILVGVLISRNSSKA
jgi:ElaB protein